MEFSIPKSRMELLTLCQNLAKLDVESCLAGIQKTDPDFVSSALNASQERKSSKKRITEKKNNSNSSKKAKHPPKRHSVPKTKKNRKIKKSSPKKISSNRSNRVFHPVVLQPHSRAVRKIRENRLKELKEKNVEKNGGFNLRWNLNNAPKTFEEVSKKKRIKKKKRKKVKKKKRILKARPNNEILRKRRIQKKKRNSLWDHDEKFRVFQKLKEKLGSRREEGKNKSFVNGEVMEEEKYDEINRKRERKLIRKLQYEKKKQLNKIIKEKRRNENSSESKRNNNSSSNSNSNNKKKEDGVGEVSRIDINEEPTKLEKDIDEKENKMEIVKKERQLTNNFDSTTSKNEEKEENVHSIEENENDKKDENDNGVDNIDKSVEKGEEIYVPDMKDVLKKKIVKKMNETKGEKLKNKRKALKALDIFEKETSKILSRFNRIKKNDIKVSIDNFFNDDVIKTPMSIGKRNEKMDNNAVVDDGNGILSEKEYNSCVKYKSDFAHFNKMSTGDLLSNSNSTKTKIIELIGEHILEEVVEEVSSEIVHVCDETVEMLFNSEFSKKKM